MAVILQPHHAVAFGLRVDPPEEPGDFLVVVLSVAAADELDAMLAR
jgi:hypothetical protein